MRTFFTLIILATLFFSAFPGDANAHKLQPAYLEINEQSTAIYSILWKRPLVANKPLSIVPRFPEICSNLTSPAHGASASGRVERWLIKCESRGLSNAEIVIEGLEKTATDTLLRIQMVDGLMHTAILRPESPVFYVPEKPSKGKIVGSYLLLGVEHILGGIDHLLFVLGLLLIVQSTSLLIKTITAFTLSHSVTLGAAALGFVHVPQAPVEAVIALSILFLATELSKQHRNEQCLTAQAPWLVALCFGLLHGFGFAGALVEVGLPQAEIPLALFFFNVGVELGQLMFVVIVLLAQRPIRKMRRRWPAWVDQVPAYGIGSLAAFWFIQRTVSFWE